MGYLILAIRSSILLSITLIIGVNAWYYLNRPPELDFSPASPFAFLVHQEGQVFHQRQDQSYWQQLSLGKEIFLDERLKTENSTAILQLKNGFFLEIQPQTIIQMEKGPHGFSQIDVVRGSILLRSQADGRIYVGLSNQTRFLFQGGEARFSRQDKQLNTEVIKGQLVVQTPSGSRVLQQGSRGKLSYTQFFLDEASIAIIEPIDHRSFILAPDRVFRVKWKTLEPSYSRVQLLAGSSYDKLKPVPVSIDLNRSELALKVDTDKMFWKLVAYSPNSKKSKRESTTFFTEFKQVRAPLAEAPARTFVPVGNSYGETLVRFYVKNPDRLSNLFIEISPNSNFHSEVHRFPMSTLEREIKLDLIGNLFWRVAGQTPDSGQIVVGEPANFAIVKHLPSDMTWAKRQNLSIDWEVELEASKNQSKVVSLENSLFQFNPERVPTGVGNVRYRFIDVSRELSNEKWNLAKRNPERIPVRSQGFYYFQVIGTDLAKKKDRLIRNELLYIEGSARLPASGL